jgi:putative transposase
LDSQTFEAWCRSVDLSDEALAVVRRIRSQEPSRSVRSGARNVSGRYSSRKMGLTIQFESHKCELPAIVEMENDKDVLEFYDQPESMKLVYRHDSGRKVGHMHTADFFVIRRESAGWEEWKMADELVRLASSGKNRYAVSESGSWTCPPGEEHARQYGLYYRVRSSEEIDWVRSRNWDFLSDYLTDVTPPVDDSIAAALMTYVASNPGITLRDLLIWVEQQP